MPALTRAPAVVGLGEVMLRLSPPPARRLENAEALTVHAAGSEANVLAALARLGVPSALVSVLPDSPLGRRAAGELAAAGVDLGHVHWQPGARMGTFFVEQGAGARPTSVWYDRAGSAFAECARWPRGVLDGARFALLSGVTPALSQAASSAASAMVAEATEEGVALCLDVNYRAHLWPPDLARAALSPLLDLATVVVCTAEDAEQLFEADSGDPAEFRSQWAPRAAVCVITHGEHGSLAVAEGEDSAISTPAVPTTVLDRLGLGDAFLAGLLHGLLEERDLPHALRAGAALAAMKATVAGDFSLACRPDLDAVLEERVRSGVVR
jgi:2-dehydro-3-deoxygluconokinase